MMIELMQMNDEARPTHPVLVNPDEIASIRAYVYHSFRPPCGSKIHFRNGDTLLVWESGEEITKKIEAAQEPGAQRKKA